MSHSILKILEEATVEKTVLYPLDVYQEKIEGLDSSGT